MKKISLILFIILISLVSIFAVTETKNFNISAFNQYSSYDQFIPTKASFLITIKNNDDDVVLNGSTVDITKKIDNSRTINNAFAVILTSNYNKNSIVVNLEFTPFVNQSDSTDKIGVTYNYSLETPQYSVGSVKINNCAYFRYLPKSYLTNNVTSVSVPSSTTTQSINLFFAVDKREERNATWNPTWGSSEWTNIQQNTSNWEKQNETLPGFASEDFISTTSNFSMTINETEYNNMDVSAQYLASVKLTVTID
ncbi:MAG: hypothetical protein HUK24_05525 [Sphaerochaetaceae bacterium]|nr:hypothetical protein [Sphaerochaetaceae bacterium]